MRLVARTEFTNILATNDVKKPEHIGLIADIAGLDNSMAERIVSRPPSGMRQVYNIYWDPNTEELVIEVSDVNTP